MWLNASLIMFFVQNYKDSDFKNKSKLLKNKEY